MSTTAKAGFAASTFCARFGHGFGGLGHEAALLHRPGEALQKSLVVVDDQEDLPLVRGQAKIG